MIDDYEPQTETQDHRGDTWRWHECDEDEGCVVVERYAKPKDEEPIDAVHMPREIWTELLLWMQREV